MICIGYRLKICFEDNIEFLKEIGYHHQGTKKSLKIKGKSIPTEEFTRDV